MGLGFKSGGGKSYESYEAGEEPKTKKVLKKGWRDSTVKRQRIKNEVRNNE